MPRSTKVTVRRARFAQPVIAGARPSQPMPRYWSVDEAWTAAESSPEFDRELRRSLGDEVAIDFPSMRGPISRMRAGFGEAVDEAPLVARVTLSAAPGACRHQGAARRAAASPVRSVQRPRRHVAGGVHAV